MNNSYLVIGATGKTGRHVVSGLAARGASVRAASRHPEQLRASGVEAVRFEWNEEDTWGPALDGVRGVYLVKPETADVVELVERFLRSMKKYGVGRLVLASECAAETRAEHLPERRVELLVEKSDLAWTILRPNWMMQDIVDDGFFGALVREYRMMSMTTGGRAIAWIDPRDIGEVAAEALVSGSAIQEAVYLTGPEALTLTQLAERISLHAGHTITAVEESVEDAEARMRTDGADDEFISYITRISESIIAGDIERVSGHVERLTGHPPRSIDSFLSTNAAQLVDRREPAMHRCSEEQHRLAGDNEVLFRRLVEAWSHNRLDDLLECYADDLVYIDMPFPDHPVRGKEAFRAHMQAYNGLFAGGEVEVDIMTAVANGTSVAGELFTRARYVGPGAPEGGIAVTWHATLVVAIVDGKVVSEHAYYDPATFDNAVAQAAVGT